VKGRAILVWGLKEWPTDFLKGSEEIGGGVRSGSESELRLLFLRTAAFVRDRVRRSSVVRIVDGPGVACRGWGGRRALRLGGITSEILGRRSPEWAVSTE